MNFPSMTQEFVLFLVIHRLFLSDEKRFCFSQTVQQQERFDSDPQSAKCQKLRNILMKHSIGSRIKCRVFLNVFNIWVWVNTYRYIFSGMNIHKSQLFWGSLGTRVLTHPHIVKFYILDIYAIYVWPEQNPGISFLSSNFLVDTKKVNHAFLVTGDWNHGFFQTLWSSYHRKNIEDIGGNNGIYDSI